jgi:PAS domain S-box-containing protein
MALPAARAYLSFGVLAVGLNAALGGNDFLYSAIGLTSVAVMLVGTAVHRPRAWRAWAGLGLSQGLFAGGDIVYQTAHSFPSWADALYLGSDVLLIGSMAWLLLPAGGARNLSSHLDAGLLALIAGVCGWSIFASDAMAEGSMLSRAVSIAYPVADLVLLALLVRVAFVRGARARSYWVLAAAVILLFLADAGEVMPALSATYQPGGWMDAAWLLSYVLFAVAALDPSMTRVVNVHEDEDTSLPVRRALVLGLGLIAVPTVMIVEHATGTAIEDLGNDIAMLVVAAGVVLRGGFLVRDLERLRRKAEQSERRFRMVFERAPIGISIGRDGIMSETNPALQRMLGYGGSELAQMHFRDTTHPDDRDLEPQRELDSGRRNAFAVDKRLIGKDGSVVEVHAHVALDLDDGLGIGLIEDVTGRRALENQLRQSQKMDSIGKLAGGIAHDFNNLMTAVIGYSDLLLLQHGSGIDGREKVEAIRDSAMRASDLTRQLLAFSRRQVMQTQEIDLRDVVERMDTLLRRLIGDDVHLKTLFGPEPVLVRADRTQLEQVVMNLAVNAREAMPAGGTLTIAVLAEGDRSILSVTDDGPGMSEETRTHIFEPFFTTKPLAEASGLGLSTVHGIVGQSGGTVHVDSAPGRGAVFTVSLPALQAAALPAGSGRATLVD